MKILKFQSQKSDANKFKIINKLKIKVEEKGSSRAFG